MEFQEYIKLKGRMGQRRVDGVCGIRCEDCPLSTMNNKYDMGCGDLEDLNPKVAEAIVKRWADEHPGKSTKTRQSMFLSIYPNANKTGDDFLDICPFSIDKNFDCEKRKEKKSCWNCKKDYWLSEIEEEENENV